MAAEDYIDLYDAFNPMYEELEEGYHTQLSLFTRRKNGRKNHNKENPEVHPTDLTTLGGRRGDAVISRCSRRRWFCL